MDLCSWDARVDFRFSFGRDPGLLNADESKEPHENEHVPIVPIEDPFEKATKYLAKHNIIGLFQVITFPLFWFLGTLLLDNQIFGIIKLS